MRDMHHAEARFRAAECDPHHDLPPGVNRVKMAAAGIDSAALPVPVKGRFLVGMDADPGG